MKPDYLAIGARLKEIRHQKELTQQALADSIGVSVSYVKNIERGSKPSIEYLFSFAAIYSVSLDWLLKGVLPTSLAAPKTIQKIEALSDPDLKRMIDILTEIMNDPDARRRTWAIIQFEDAFKSYYASLDEKKARA